MSLLSQYTILLRYFSPSRRALVAIAAEGVVLQRRIDDDDRKIAARRKPEHPYEKWIEAKRSEVARLPAWAASIDELPSLEDIENWITDSVCPTPTGDEVEPDGVGPDGAPSWLLALGLI